MALASPQASRRLVTNSVAPIGREYRPRHLALPFRIEQIVVGLRRVRRPGPAWCCRRSRNSSCGSAPTARADRAAAPECRRSAATRPAGPCLPAPPCSPMPVPSMTSPDRIVRAHLGGDLGGDLFGIGAPERHLDERIFFLERCRYRAQRLIDDHAGVEDDLALLFGAVDQLLGRDPAPCRSGCSSAVCADARQRRSRLATGARRHVERAATPSACRERGRTPRSCQALLRRLCAAPAFGVTPQPIGIGMVQHAVDELEPFPAILGETIELGQFRGVPDARQRRGKLHGVRREQHRPDMGAQAVAARRRRRRFARRR